VKRALVGVLGAALLSGCQVLAIFFPIGQLQLSNQSSLTVTVRIGPFKAGTSVVQAAQAIQTFTLTPAGSQTVQLPTGHYSVYAEANTPQAEAAGNDVTLAAGKPVYMDLQERVEDHLPATTTEGQRVRTLGWTVE
jgi:hypothetical protein